MKIHSDILTREDIIAATADMPGVYADVWEAGSRARSHALEVRLTGTSSHRPNNGGQGDDYAATWDEWGIFFAALYAKDEDMLAGSSGRPAYASATAYHAATGGRFLTLTAASQHRRHRWEFVGADRHECKCGATTDRSFTYVKP